MRHHCPGRERGPGPGPGAWRLVRPGPGCPVVPRSSRGASSRPGMAPEPPHKHLSLLGPQASPGQGSAWNRRWRWRVGEGEGLGRVAALRRAWQRCRGWGSPLQEMSGAFPPLLLWPGLQPALPCWKVPPNPARPGLSLGTCGRAFT